MFSRDTIVLLRFHFSLFLLPVFLFALASLPSIHTGRSLLVFFILHVLVYPASNGYNSYMDRDETPIGGLEKPPPPPAALFRTTLVMDALALLLSFFISWFFASAILLYILASRAYSYRGIRLKKFPVTGFLVVIFFQGAWVYLLTYHGASLHYELNFPLLPMIASSLLLGGYYPLTQVYQHEADRKDGVRTLSMLLGIRGTFIFTAFMFLLATISLFLVFSGNGKLNYFLLFLTLMAPALLFFGYWMKKCWKDENAANFKNSLRMNLIASAATTLFFGILLVIQ